MKNYEFHSEKVQKKEEPSSLQIEYKQPMKQESDLPLNPEMLGEPPEGWSSKMDEEEKKDIQRRMEVDWKAIRRRRILLMPVIQLALSVMLKLFWTTGLTNQTVFIVLTAVFTLSMMIIAHHEARYFRHAATEMKKPIEQNNLLFYLIQFLPTLLLILVFDPSVSTWLCMLPAGFSVAFGNNGWTGLLLNAVLYFLPIFLITQFEFKLTGWMHRIGF